MNDCTGLDTLRCLSIGILTDLNVTRRLNKLARCITVTALAALVSIKPAMVVLNRVNNGGGATLVCRIATLDTSEELTVHVSDLSLVSVAL